MAGFVVVWITARTLSDPLRALREALARVERGELDRRRLQHRSAAPITGT